VGTTANDAITLAFSEQVQRGGDVVSGLTSTAQWLSVMCSARPTSCSSDEQVTPLRV
jgi:hypothetical protein